MGGESFESKALKSCYPKLAERPKGKLIPNIYKDRIAQFTAGGQYESKNLLACVLSLLMSAIRANWQT